MEKVSIRSSLLSPRIQLSRDFEYTLQFIYLQKEASFLCQIYLIRFSIDALIYYRLFERFSGKFEKNLKSSIYLIYVMATII